MKAMIVLMILIAVGVFAVYHFGGYGKLDPAQQGETARAAINAGMTWQQVVKAAGAPKRYAIFIETGKNQTTGEPLIEPGPEMAYDFDVIARRIADKTAPHGFIFPYRFSANTAFKVEFDAAGTVVFVEELPTINTLLDMPKK